MAALASASDIWIRLEFVTTTPASEVDGEVGFRDTSLSVGLSGKAEGLAQVWVASTHEGKVAT